jgi:hypothetical protein
LWRVIALIWDFVVIALAGVSATAFVAIAARRVGVTVGRKSV